jgi:hypothetical protein
VRGLEELRQEEQDAIHRGIQEEARRDSRCKGIGAEEPHRQHWLARAQLPADEGGGQQKARSERCGNFEAAPARAVPAHETPRQTERGARHQRNSGNVEGRTRSEALVDATRCQWDNEHGDRQIDPEDPLPRQALRNSAADHWPRDESDARNTTEEAKGPPALFTRKGRSQERHRERHDQGRAGSLEGARGDQQADAGCQPTRDRSAGKESDAVAEHAPASEAVAERGAGQQQHGKAEVVGVDGPLQRFERRPEADLDGAQGHRDDHSVERDHA